MRVQPRWDNPKRSPEGRTNPPYLSERNQFALLLCVNIWLGDPMRLVAGISNRRGTRAQETAIRKLTLGLVGAVTVAAAGLLLMRQQTQPKEAVAEAESAAGAITLERMRELGL